MRRAAAAQELGGFTAEVVDLRREFELCSYVRSLAAEILSETSLIGKSEQTRGKALF